MQEYQNKVDSLIKNIKNNLHRLEIEKMINKSLKYESNNSTEDSIDVSSVNISSYYDRAIEKNPKRRECEIEQIKPGTVYYEMMQLISQDFDKLNSKVSSL